MDTSKFKTKTEYIFRNNGHTKNVYEVALDIGYSAVKLFGPSIVARFPSYARRISRDFDFMVGPNDTAIVYTDNVTGERWLVGEAAQAQINQKDTSDSESALYGRERYGTPMFKVIARCGLGIGMLNSNFSSEFNPAEKSLVVQSGLPEKYLSMDKELLTDVLSGQHSFTLQIGKHKPVTFDFTLEKDNVYIMSQPKGTLFSVCIDKNGNWHSEAKKYMTSSVLVFDPGFGTLDIFPIRSGAVDGNGETFADLGMKRVMQETVNHIKTDSGVEIAVPAIQKYLETGEYRYTDRATLTSKNVSFGDILKECNQRVCEEALNRMMSIFDIIDYDYLIITGGTGAAWLSMIREKFANLETLRIIEGNQNDGLPFVYSNVRGYYLYRFSQLIKIHGRE